MCLHIHTQIYSFFSYLCVSLFRLKDLKGRKLVIVSPEKYI